MTPLDHGGYSVISCGRYLEIQEQLSLESAQVSFTCPETDLNFWFQYFDLNTDYQAILNSIQPEDAYLTDVYKRQGLKNI